MAYVICEPCIGVKDASCVDVCPVDCIHTTDQDEQYYINPELYRLRRMCGCVPGAGYLL